VRKFISLSCSDKRGENFIFLKNNFFVGGAFDIKSLPNFDFYEIKKI